MSVDAVVIPDKIYFKIGEVCELVGVQAHVLRYWESEFSVLCPQKNKSGQRSYRRRDVEIALRIKQLLYSEMFTIAGARKKIQSEARGDGGKTKSPVASTGRRQAAGDPSAPTLFDTGFDTISSSSSGVPTLENGAERMTSDSAAMRTLRNHLLDLRDMLNSSPESRASPDSRGI